MEKERLEQERVENERKAKLAQVEHIKSVQKEKGLDSEAIDPNKEMEEEEERAGI